MTKAVKEIVLVMLVVLAFQNSKAQTSTTASKECEEKTVTLETEFKSRNRFFF